jgi:beta-galactosidase
MEITRRGFIQNSALFTASAAIGHEAEVPKGETSAGGINAAPKAGMPVFPYGAVYLRKSNPPEQDWAHDHATAAPVGMNTFRHWFMWSAIEGREAGAQVCVPPRFFNCLKPQAAFC